MTNGDVREQVIVIVKCTGDRLEYRVEISRFVARVACSKYQHM